MSLCQNAFFRKTRGQGLCLLMLAFSFVGSTAKADSYYDYKNGKKYLCTSEQDSCEPTLSKGACVNGTRRVTVIACDGSTSAFNESCEVEKIYSCNGCWQNDYSREWSYGRLIDGYINTGGHNVGGFEDRAECLAARDADNWCHGNP